MRDERENEDEANPNRDSYFRMKDNHTLETHHVASGDVIAVIGEHLYVANSIVSLLSDIEHLVGPDDHPPYIVHL